MYIILTTKNIRIFIKNMYINPLLKTINKKTSKKKKNKKFKKKKKNLYIYLLIIILTNSS